VVVCYILTTLRSLVPEATATLDRRLPPVGIDLWTPVPEILNCVSM
jgi:hypothetical protein